MDRNRERRFMWRRGDALRYFHPVTGEPLGAEEWQRIVLSRAKAMLTSQPSDQNRRRV